MKKSGNIIVVDDNKHVLTALKLLLTGSFETVTLLPSPKTLLSTIVEVHPDVLLLDMNFSTGINTGNEGLYWLDQVRSRFPDLPVVLFTAYADIEAWSKRFRSQAVEQRRAVGVASHGDE